GGVVQRLAHAEKGHRVGPRGRGVSCSGPRLREGRAGFKWVRSSGGRRFSGRESRGGGRLRPPYEIAPVCPRDYFARSSSTATAGSTLPSTNSRKAPPPVEM